MTETLAARRRHIRKRRVAKIIHVNVLNVACASSAAQSDAKYCNIRIADLPNVVVADTKQRPPSTLDRRPVTRTRRPCASAAIR